MIKRAAALLSLHFSLQKKWEIVLEILAAIGLFILWFFSKLDAYCFGRFSSEFFSVMIPVMIFVFFCNNESPMMKSSPNSILSQVYLPPIICSIFLIADAMLTWILMENRIETYIIPDSLTLILYSALAAAEMAILPAALRKLWYALAAGAMVWLSCSVFIRYEHTDTKIEVSFAGIIGAAVIAIGCFVSIQTGKHFFGYEPKFKNIT